MENFTPVTALIGGVLIGASAALLMLMNGRLAGVSSIVAGVVPPGSVEQAAWRGLFLAGLVAGALIHRTVIDPGASIAIAAPLPALLIGGVLVGVGTRIGSGCTSGHGVCGLARLSPRSLVATLTFMAVAMLVVFAVRHLAGGW